MSVLVFMVSLLNLLKGSTLFGFVKWIMKILCAWRNAWFSSWSCHESGPLHANLMEWPASRRLHGMSAEAARGRIRCRRYKEKARSLNGNGLPCWGWEGLDQAAMDHADLIEYGTEHFVVVQTEGKMVSDLLPGILALLLP